MSLRIWLPLDGDLHNQGISDYIITAVEASPTFTAGKIGQCYQRANTSSQITNGLQIQDNLLSTFGATASVAVWVKPLGTHTHYNGTILSSGNWNSKRWAFGVSQDNSQVDVLCGGYNNYISCAVPVNQWTHLVSTFNNGVCKLYKNGIYVGEKTNQAAFDSDANWTGICRETYANGYFGFNGCINDLRIYDHCLSAAEIKEIAQGLILHYKLDRPNINLVSGALLGKSIKTTRGNDYIEGQWDNLSGGNGTVTALQDSSAYIGNYIYRIANNTSGNKDIGQYSANQHFTLISGQKYTMSAYYRGKCSTRIRIWDSTRGVQLVSLTGNIDTGTEWQRVTETFTATDAMTGENDIGFLFGLNGNSNGNVDICGMKVEIGENATAWSPSALEIDITKIQDDSGYNHTAEITGNLTAENNSIRYLNNIYIENGTQQYIRSPVLYLPQDAITLNIWFKSTNTAPTGNYHMIVDSNANRQWYEMAVHNTGYFRAGLFINGTRYADNGSSKICLNGNWHMLTLTYDGATIKRYVDGVMEKSTNVVISTGLSSPTALTIGRDGPSAAYACKQVSLNDFRIYATALTEADIINLYKTSMYIDNKANISPFEINENEANTINSQGILNDNIIEPFITLPDGSHWQLLLFHKVDGGTRLFTSSNATYCNDYGLFSRLAYVNNFTYNNQYEFYVIQDGTEFRWTQTSQPTAASIAGKTVVEGYNDPVNGLAKANQSNTYIGYNSWWGACGCYKTFTQSGKTGIPGFGPHSAEGICTDYLALYTRIEEPHAYIEETSIQAEEFIER